MIEMFTNEQIDILINDLKQNGYTIKEPTLEKAKITILREEADKLDMGKIFAAKGVADLIYGAADMITDNYKKTRVVNGKTYDYRRTVVPAHLIDEYSKVVRAILEALKPWYGKLGFRAI